jgi:transposase
MKKTYVGIDVSKDDFVVAYRIENQTIKTEAYENNKKGIKTFLKMINQDCWCIMEATGIYHLSLALAISIKDIDVSVVNPLQIKRFSQTKLSRTKTDKADAILIAEYGSRMKPKLYTAPEEFVMELKQLRSLVRMLKRNNRALLNQMHVLKRRDDTCKMALKICKSTIKSNNKQIKTLEDEMEKIVKEHCKDIYNQLCSIPSISRITATEFIIVSNAFKNFDTAKEFACFIGISPCINESGSSIRGYRGISRIGDAHTRSTLYMCAMMAKVCNKACKDTFDRLVERGKPKKLALIAVMNKLIKQAFAIVKSGSMYCENHQTKLVENFS